MLDDRDDFSRLNRAVSKNVKPRTTKVRQPGIVDVQQMPQRANHAGVTDDEGGAICTPTAEIEECPGHAVEDLFVTFETLRLAALLQVTGPTLFDLHAGETFPRTNVCFLQALIDFHRTDAEVFGDDRSRVPSSLKMTRGDEFERSEGLGRLRRLTDTFVTEWNIGATLPALFDVPQGLSVSQNQQ